MSEIKAVASYDCRGDRRNTRIAFFLFLGIGALAILLLAVRVVSSVVWQAIAMIALCVAAYIFIRYMATGYRYEIVSEEDGDYLLIIHVQGKRQVIRRKLAMAALVALIEIKNTPNAPKERPNLPVSNYSSHLMADEYTLLHFEGSESALLRVNIDDEFRSVLVSYLPDAEEEDAQENAQENQEPVNSTEEENDVGSC